MGEPFSDLKVADFSWVGVGPLITKYLADFGATVVRIESKRHPDVIRLSAPYAEGIPGVDRSGYFLLMNSNKYSISVNLETPQGLDIAKRLVKWSDIVVESFRPGVMEKYGLSYENLQQLKRDIIAVRVSIQGQTGPRAKQPGLGYQTTGMLGFPLLTGWPDREPTPLPVAYADYVAYHFGTAALVAALDYRQRTGKGLYLDLSQLEASLHFLAPVIMDYEVNSREPVRAGNSSSGAAPHGVYRCLGNDQWCAIAVTNDQEWGAFVKAMGNPLWAERPVFATLVGRSKNTDEMDRLVESCTVNFSAERLMHMLQEAGVPCGIVADGEHLVNDPHLKARGYYWELEHPEMGLSLHASQPFKLSKTPAKPRMPAPCIGEHSEFVCREILRLSDTEFLELLNTGGIE